MERATIKCTIFAKKMRSEKGEYRIFITKLPNKVTGEVITARVKFTEGTPEPAMSDCPVNVIVYKDKSNLAHYVRNDKQYHTLWIGEYEYSSEKFVDTSLDEY